MACGISDKLFTDQFLKINIINENVIRIFELLNIVLFSY